MKGGPLFWYQVGPTQGVKNKGSPVPVKQRWESQAIQ